MQIIDKNIITGLNKPKSESHKGQNGRILVIAGSDRYHGALIMAVKAASRVVDMVYVHSTDSNLKLIDKLKSVIATFISIKNDDLWNTIEIVDSILIGPGLEENKKNKKLVEKILKKYPEKKVIVDATALWHVDPYLLHPNCVVTPHSREFKQVFDCDPTEENVKKMAKYFQCTIVFTGETDIVSAGQEVWQNKTGNEGMTKGGTGDVLAGIITALSTKNDLLLSAQAGIYLNGLAGDKLKEKVGTFFNAEDLIGELGDVWREYVG